MVVALSDALPLTGADGSSGRNNGRDIRKGLLSSLLLPDTKANPLAVRNGVLSHDYDVGGVTSLRVDCPTPNTASVVLKPGAFVTERAGQGPYIGWLETSSGISITPATCDATNPRYDVVYVGVYDKASISLDPQTDAYVDIVTGTPSATPTVPAVTADGAVPLAQIYRPAGSTVISPANVTDVRRSSGLVGTVRRMLPGDALSNAGKVDGELRYRQAVGSLPSLIDYWDAAQNLWRGTQGFIVTQVLPGTPDAGLIVSGSVTTPGQIVQVTIPDPGWPYRVRASAAINVSGVGGTVSCNTFVTVNGGPLASIIYSTPAGPVVLAPNGGDIYTGSATVRLRIDLTAGGINTVAWNTDVRNLLTCRVDPA